jgi:hypothetical protein
MSMWNKQGSSLSHRGEWRRCLGLRRNSEHTASIDGVLFTALYEIASWQHVACCTFWQTIGGHHGEQRGGGSLFAEEGTGKKWSREGREFPAAEQPWSATAGSWPCPAARKEWSSAPRKKSRAERRRRHGRPPRAPTTRAEREKGAGRWGARPWSREQGARCWVLAMEKSRASACSQGARPWLHLLGAMEKQGAWAPRLGGSSCAQPWGRQEQGARREERRPEGQLGWRPAWRKELAAGEGWRPWEAPARRRAAAVKKRGACCCA